MDGKKNKEKQCCFLLLLLQHFHMFLTCVTVNGVNVILVAAEYGVRDPLSAVGLLTGLHFGDPSALTKRK